MQRLPSSRAVRLWQRALSVLRRPLGWLGPFAVVLALGLAGETTAGGKDHEDVRLLVQEGTILPLETLLERALTGQPGHLLEAELERKGDRWVYELEILDPEGRVWEMYYDARSGELLRREED